MSTTKHLHLLPILSFLPLIAALLAITRYNVFIDSFLIGSVAIIYVALNIIYRHMHGSLQIGYIVEYSLVALIAYFVLTVYA
ncbi:MAG TPA: hypothetical protein VF996_02950 [Candidatus Saccharimonadales bacterium]|jgi:hypothetical protein